MNIHLCPLFLECFCHTGRPSNWDGEYGQISISQFYLPPRSLSPAANNAFATHTWAANYTCQSADGLPGSHFPTGSTQYLRAEESWWRKLAPHSRLKLRHWCHSTLLDACFRRKGIGNMPMTSLFSKSCSSLWKWDSCISLRLNLLPLSITFHHAQPYSV